MISLVEKSEKIAVKTFQLIKNSISENNRIVVTYCGTSEGLATYIATVLKISKPDLNILVLDANYSHNIVIPYIAEYIDNVIVVSSLTNMKCVHRIIQTILALGLNGIIFLPVPKTVIKSSEDEKQSLEYKNIEIIEIESDIYRLSIMQTFLQLVLHISGKKIHRINRIERELELKNIVEELISKYSREIILSNDVKHVFVSKALTTISEELLEKGINTSIIDESLNNAKIETPLLIIYTTVEEFIVNEFVLNLIRNNIKQDKIISIKINTDPLTAPLYSLILIHMMFKKDKTNDKFKAPESRLVAGSTAISAPG